ncbi:leucine-rich repeat-containing protein let-4 [Monomorium pharaonis]|uniref:leucine-rich repeat-containing protein let-4 n=1 Tax=Monomorium pharaonis TaxID=307658 RepID=UPI00063F242A|nr:leucine-rich repeat-containing protein let-4 [Monomorium pharaonis]
MIFNIITLLLLFLCNQCLCDICKTCVCSASNAGLVINCHDKHLGINEVLYFDLLTLDKNKPLNQFILSKNNIVLLPMNELKNLKHLKKLDVSQNQLDSIHSHVFENLNKLEDLDYSSNSLWSFDISILNSVASLSKLNLSHNHISNLEKSMENTKTKLKILDVSHNKLVDLNFLDGTPELEYLNLSFNKFTTLSVNSLLYMQHLKILYINSNHLLSLNLKNLPLSLLELHAENNLINIVSFQKSLIHTLNIQNNNISSIHNLTLLEELKNLNVSRNFLSDFPDVSLENLETLDISFNNLTIIPETISSKNFPNLSIFKINGNCLKDIKIRSKLNLEIFEVKFIETIEKVDKETFLMLKEKKNNCINITISSNLNLNMIQENVFQHMNICSLDLSNNSFTHLSSELFNLNVYNTSNLKYLINLQGNPFICNCSLQWMLNKLIPKLYIMNPSLLEDLRCADPPPLANKRMIHWYKWKGEVFCDKFSHLSERMTVNIAGVSSNQVVTFKTGPGMIAVLATMMTLLIILIIIGILLTRRMTAKRRRVNRRL